MTDIDCIACNFAYFAQNHLFIGAEVLEKHKSLNYVANSETMLKQ